MKKNTRAHKRAVRQGTEWFDADGVKLEPSDTFTQQQKDADDNQRILSELPPHWGIFEERSS